MNPSSKRRYLQTLYVALVVLSTGLLALSAGCGKKKNPTGPTLRNAPEAWAGVWSVRTRAKLCGTSELLADTTIVQAVCEGDTLNTLLEDGGVSLCEGGGFSGTATTSTFSCSQNINDEGCVGVLTVNLTTTVNSAAGTSHGTGQVKFNAGTGNIECPNVCVDLTLDGTRVGPEPASCNSLTALPGSNLRALVARFGAAAPGGALVRLTAQARALIRSGASRSE